MQTNLDFDSNMIFKEVKMVLRAYTFSFTNSIFNLDYIISVTFVLFSFMSKVSDSQTYLCQESNRTNSKIALFFR